MASPPDQSPDVKEFDSELIERGGSFGERTRTNPVAISRCSVEVADDEAAERCVTALIQFERYLRKRPDDAKFYEWANIRRKGHRFDFDIYWYDRRFFEERKEAYKVGAHALAFQRFGTTPSDFSVRHQSVPADFSHV